MPFPIGAHCNQVSISSRFQNNGP